jgi:hypothetical protein
MKDERLRVPVGEDYVAALGRATYVFSYTEWVAAYCCEKMESGFVGKLRTNKMTAGNIADKLVSLVGKRPAGPDTQRCVDAAAEFKRLTLRRNDLIHSNPGTAPSGDQQLFRHGNAWTVQSINDVADEFATNGIELNDIYHKVL